MIRVKKARNETESHNLIKRQAVNELRGMGFKENEIFTEYVFFVKRKGYTGKTVDVVGIKDDYKVAIECGSMNRGRVKLLSIFFDKVYHFPYLKKLNERYRDEDIIKKEEIISIIGENNEIEIPPFFRAFLKLEENDEIVWTYKGNDVCVVKFVETKKNEK